MYAGMALACAEYGYAASYAYFPGLWYCGGIMISNPVLLHIFHRCAKDSKKEGLNMISFNQKETSYLQDAQKMEELCIKKYAGYANQAQDPELKQLMTQLGQQEQQHLDSINQLLAGQLPSTGGGQQQAGQQQGAQQTVFPPISGGAPNQSDAVLCEDQLSTEKHVSSTYNTAVFEFRDANVRQILNHIQKEEQQHGERIFNYMASHGMYTVPQ
jgi:spore coat protein CotF